MMRNILKMKNCSRYLSIASLYYREADAAVICYDVSQLNTFQKLNYWINELRNVVPKCRIYICATKSDLLYKYEANPSLSFAESYALQHDATFVVTSSKTGQNISSYATLYIFALDRRESFDTLV